MSRRLRFVLGAIGILLVVPVAYWFAGPGWAVVGAVLAGVAPWGRGGALFGGPASYRGDLFYELRRERTRTFRRAIAVLLLFEALGVAIMAFELSLRWWAVGCAIALFVGPVAMALIRWRLLSRRAWPAGQVLEWWVRADQQNWRSIDGGGPPRSPNEGLLRLADRDDDLATAMRLALERGQGDLDGMRAGLANWHPSDPVFRTRRERLLSQLAYAEGVDDLSAAQAATTAIPDEQVRLAEDTLIAIEVARRRAMEGQDALAPLISARLALSPTSLAFLDIRSQTSCLSVLVLAVGLVFLGAVLLWTFMILFH